MTRGVRNPGRVAGLILGLLALGATSAPAQPQAQPQAPAATATATQAPAADGPRLAQARPEIDDESRGLGRRPRTDGARAPDPRWSFHRTLVIEAAREDNFDLDHERGDREHVTEIEPLLRLGLRWKGDGGWTAFGETELLHKAERERGERTRHRARALLNQAWIGHEGLMPGLELRAGRWLQRDEREWLFDENLDGLQARYERKRWSGELMWSRVNHWRRDLLNNAPHGGDVDVSGGLLRHEGRGDLNSAAWMLWHEDRDRGDRRRHFGLRAHVDPDEDFAWRVDLSLVRGRIDGEPLRGWAYDVGAQWRASDWRWQPRISLGHAQGSGDGNPDDGVRREHHQTGLQSNEAQWGNQGKFKIYGELVDPELRNVRITSLGLGIEPVTKLSVDLLWHHLRQSAIGPVDDMDLALDPRGDRYDRSHLGDEIDLLVGWQPDRQRRLEVALGWFRPSARLRDGDEADSERAGRALFARVEWLWRF